MILLVGGTSETAAIAAALAGAGYRVLVSTATDEPLDIAAHPNIRRRSGRLDEAAMLALVRREKIRAIVDAAHPYAAAVHATAHAVARVAGVVCVRFARPASITAGPGVHRAKDHVEAAKLAFSFGEPVLLTTGASNLSPYAAEAARAKITMVARVLPREESIFACSRVGLDVAHIIAAKGPFTLEQNIEHIRRHGIGTLVTKDGGEAGGTAAKLEAARQEHCQVVVVDRPATPDGDTATDIPGLLDLVRCRFA